MTDQVLVNTLAVVAVAAALAAVGMVDPSSPLYTGPLFVGQQLLSGESDSFMSPPGHSHLRGFMATVFGIVGWYVGCVLVGRTASPGFRKSSAIGRFVWGSSAIGVCIAAGGPAGLILVLLVVDIASGAHLWVVRSEGELKKYAFTRSLEPVKDGASVLDTAAVIRRNSERKEKYEAEKAASGLGSKQGHFASVYVHPMVGVPVAVLLLVRPKVAFSWAGRFAGSVLGGYPSTAEWTVGTGGDPVVVGSEVEVEQGEGQGSAWEVWARLSAIQMALFSFAMMSVRSKDFFASLLMRGGVLAGAVMAVAFGAHPAVMVLYAAPHLVSLPVSLIELAGAGWGGWQGGVAKAARAKQD